MEEAPPYTIVYHPKRKRLAIRITLDGIHVLAPTHCSKRHIHQFVQTHQTWIKRHQTRYHTTDIVHVTQGAHFHYLGRSYTLHFSRGPEAHVTKKNATLYVQAKTPSQCPAVLIDWCQQQANHYIVPRVVDHAKKLGVSPHKIAIKNQKSRWGSCSNLGNVYFNWRLILMPCRIIDYVIVHELAHLIQLNHSPAFWCIVATHIPNVAAKRRWLRQNGLRYSHL